MVDVASIVVAVVALVGTIITAGLAYVQQWFADERKRISEGQRLVRKYRDPLLRAALELQSRLWNICDHQFLKTFPGEQFHEVTVLYTCYLIGSFLVWENILQVQAQFASFDEDEHNRWLNRLLSDIREVFASSGYGGECMLFRGQQRAICERMTIRQPLDKDNGELLCMGFATFCRKFEDQQDDLSRWFRPILEGLHELQQHDKSDRRKKRLRCLQHLLLELMDWLDPSKIMWERESFGLCQMGDIRNWNDCRCALESCRSKCSPDARKHRTRSPMKIDRTSKRQHAEKGPIRETV